MKRRSLLKTGLASAVVTFCLTSCGIFLQETGVKNYSPKENISSKGMNNYQSDFTYLKKVVEEGFPQIDSVFSKEDREAKYTEIMGELNGTTKNVDFVLQMRKYLSNLKNQHTTLYLQHEFENYYPYVVYHSYDKWYLSNTSKSYDSLHLGKEIVKINNIKVSEAERVLIDFTFSENKINQQREINNWQFYNEPEYLKEAGIINDYNELVTLTFKDSTSLFVNPVSRETKVEWYKFVVERNNMTAYKRETYAYQLYPELDMGYLQFNASHDKIDILDGIESYVKPWLQPVARGYVKKQFKKSKPSKRIARYYNPKYPVFQDFVRELVDSLNTSKVKNLVIDLRYNPGGNLTLGEQLLYFLTDNNNLKGFSEYAFTSPIYESYFPKEFNELKQKYSNELPLNSLVLKKEDNTLFDEITDSTSKYFITRSRPVFKGNIFVLANYNTGSAAAMLTTLFQDNNIATVIGTSVGNNPIGATTLTPMKLPKTKAKISIASTYMIRPDVKAGKIQIPDYWVEYSLKDIRNGVDPYIVKVQELIEGNK